LEEKEVKNNIKNSEKPKPNGKVLRCINIDCVFNSSNQHGAIRNTCSHPNVIVESRFADITIAICSEFRSKKDYAFEKPATLIDLKSKEKTEIVGRPAVGATTIEKVTTQDLEQEISHKESTYNEKTSRDTPQETIAIKNEDLAVKPVVIESGEVKQDELLPSEIYNLTDRPGSNFLILKKIYQPNTRTGLIVSIGFHLFLILMMWQFLVPKDETADDTTNNQRIVVVEDVEMPKFEPPDLDKLKEEEEKLKEEEVKDNTANIRPKINNKRITPNIKRPNTNDDVDTNKIVTNDSSKIKNDSNLTKNNRDTNRIVVPDSMKAAYDQNDVGLKMWFPVGWKLMDNRQVNLNQKEFNGVIVATDSTSEDPGAVNMFVIIDDPKHSKYNKATYKNPFPMDDSLTVAYVTDPQKGSGKRMSTKYFLFTDPTGLKNIEVNVEFASQAMMEKYQKLVDAVVRSIKIAPPPNKEPGP
jgi:hypothetical protein